MKYSHYIYGLNICSDIGFPELMIGESSVEPDIILRFGRIEIQLEQPIKSDQDLGFQITANQVAILSQQLGRFLVCNGNEIVVDPNPDADEQAIRSLTLDILLPAVLHQRGFLLLHASAVACGGAIAFIGPSGAGKSTMAVAMHTYRHHHQANPQTGGIFTDDMVAISFDAAGTPLVMPGFFQLKFLPETVHGIEHLKENISSEIDPFTKKHLCSNDTYFAKQAMPLTHIYLLADDDDISLEPVAPQECFLQLMHNSYATGFLTAAASSAQQFQHYMQLAQKVSIQRLKRPKSFAILPDLVKLVEQNSHL